MTAEDTAALACLAALTDWFDPATETDVDSFINPEEPARVVEFLFGQLIAVIDDYCEAIGAEPEAYMQALALQHQALIAG